MSKRVFISYRREDAASAAGRVYDRLSLLLSKSQVFFDVSTIRGGEDFAQGIASQIERSDVVLIFIGDKWLGRKGESGKERIWEPNDYVRAEVRAAMARPMLIVPVLVADARMPRPEQLPEDIRSITTKHALRLSHEAFDDDTENIVVAVLGGFPKKRVWEEKGTPWSKIAYGIGGVVAASTLILLGALIHFWLLGRPISASVGGPLTVLMLIAGSIVGIWLGLRYEALRRKPADHP